MYEDLIREMMNVSSLADTVPLLSQAVRAIRALTEENAALKMRLAKVADEKNALP